jgi:hypothetical protein
MAARKSPIVLSLALGAVLAAPGATWAQAPAARPGSLPRPPAMSLTPEQLDAFVELTGDPKPVVWQRLLADPGLVPFAAAAGDARLERRSSGKTMTIAGFTILGVGTGVGYGIFLWGFASGIDCSNYAGTCEPSKTKMLGGLVLMVASLATGLSLGIPGIIRMVRASEAENEASGRYQTPGLPQLPAYPAAYSPPMTLRAPAIPLSLPLLSFRF